MEQKIEENPIQLDLEKESIEEFQKRFPVAKIIDTYKKQLEELFFIRNPHFRFEKEYAKELQEFLNDHFGNTPIQETGEWFYFSWNNLLVHYLSDALHQEIRTARNKNLITKKEQEKFYNACDGIGGLSVGSHAALTLVMMGGTKKLKLADPDEISASNLNRIRSDFTNIGVKKYQVVAQQIFQMNPYSQVSLYPAGITPQNIREFFEGPQKLDIIVDELDDLQMKVRLRLEAKRLGIPVVMATDNGDNVIVDIERYDLDKNVQIFNGAIGDMTLKNIQNFPPSEFPKLAARIAGVDLIVPRMKESLLEVGKTLYSWPQLGDAATLSGIAVAYVVRKIATGENIRSGKIDLNLDLFFKPA